MAKTLSKSGIATSGTITAAHVTQSIDALTGVDAYNITISGSNVISGSLAVSANVDFNGDLDVDGTTNLDVVDIDGAVDMASNLTIAGTISNVSTTHITASSNISASGVITAEGLVISDDASITDTLTVGTIANINTTHITASGNISSSGNIIANNFTASNAFHAQAHNGFEFTTSGGGFNMINQTADQNFFFLTSAGAGTINFGTNNQNSEVVIGTGGHISASANISASGVIAKDLTVDGTISGSGHNHLLFPVTTLNNGTSGDSTTFVNSNNHPNQTLFQLILNNTNGLAGSRDLTLSLGAAAQNPGIRYTFVVKEAANAQCELKITAASSTLQGLIVNEADGRTAISNRTTITIGTSDSDRGDRFDCICDGTYWYVYGFRLGAEADISLS